jgi:hypothetical protein
MLSFHFRGGLWFCCTWRRVWDKDGSTDYCQEISVGGKEVRQGKVWSYMYLPKPTLGNWRSVPMGQRETLHPIGRKRRLPNSGASLRCWVRGENSLTSGIFGSGRGRKNSQAKEKRTSKCHMGMSLTVIDRGLTWEETTIPMFFRTSFSRG